jgi:predicted nucleic acid-binding protein
MKTVFADAFYFFALANEKDPACPKAQAFADSYLGIVVTTGWVITEVGDGLSHPDNRQTFLNMVDALYSEPDIHVVPCDDQLFRAGIELYRKRPDKAWSLTDCISFVVMQREGITEALTGDRHFEQAGFVAIFK